MHYQVQNYQVITTLIVCVYNDNVLTLCGEILLFIDLNRAVYFRLHNCRKISGKMLHDYVDVDKKMLLLFQKLIAK